MVDDPKQRETALLITDVVYLCEYPVLSVVLLQDVLQSQLDLLLQLLNLYLLLEPGPVCVGSQVF